MRLIWATRGALWGFRFLRDGGFADPLPVYEHAFSGVGASTTVLRRCGEQVVLRFPDPLERTDRSGRPIPHEFVLFESLAEQVTSPALALSIVWPLVADEYARVWDTPSYEG